MRGKIGIVTLQGRSNYGNRLQNFAVSRLYEKRGFEAVSLLYECNTGKAKLKKAVKRLLGRGVSCPEDSMSKKRLEAFDRFNALMNFKTVDRLDENLCEEFDYFSVGSDQVWNLGRGTDYDNWYFLSFAKECQRIALAPSIGLDKVDDSLGSRIGAAVRGFPCLSVREYQGACIIKEHSGCEAVVLCDPTMALSREEWISVSDNRITPSSPYVLTYLLGERNVEADNVVESLREIYGKDMMILPLSDKEREGEIPAGPAEFVSLINNACHVVTDSFHAAVFSCLLKTPLTIVHREGGAAMFSRLNTLSAMLGIENKVYGCGKYEFSKAGDWDGVEERILLEKSKMDRYIDSCLG